MGRRQSPRYDKISTLTSDFFVMCELLSLVITYHPLRKKFLPCTLFGRSCRQFLEQEISDLIDDISLANRHNLWFMHDGSTSRFSLIIKQYIDESFPNPWIGGSRSIACLVWPPVCNLYWTIMYAISVPTVNVLRSLRNQAFDVTRKPLGILKRIRRWEACAVQSQHFEHFI